MLHIHLMHPHGSTRLAMNQPEDVTDPAAVNAWLALFALMNGAARDREIRVRFMTRSGHAATAVLVGGDCLLDMGKEDGMSLFMYASDILPERGNAYDRL